jgi:hypothetical protein
MMSDLGMLRRISNVFACLSVRQCRELAEKILQYHRDEDYKIVRLRDDLITEASILMGRRSETFSV